MWTLSVDDEWGGILLLNRSKNRASATVRARTLILETRRRCHPSLFYVQIERKKGYGQRKSLRTGRENIQEIPGGGLALNTPEVVSMLVLGLDSVFVGAAMAKGVGGVDGSAVVVEATEKSSGSGGGKFSDGGGRF